MSTKSYETVSEAMTDLNKRGYTLDFSIFAEEECLVCKGTSLQLSPEEFEIDEIYRFEGNTDPGDEMIVYAISSPKYGAKGMLVNAFGTYADSRAPEIVKYLHRRKQKG